MMKEKWNPHKEFDFYATIGLAFFALMVLKSCS